MPERMSRARLVLYCLGATGFLLAERVVANIGLYFYLPPAGRGLAAQVPQQVFVGGLTAFGLAMLIGRFCDAFSAPLAGYLSDRTVSRFGRRRLFLMIGVLPTALLPPLIFFPPAAPGSAANAVYLAVVLSVFFVFFTTYVTPFFALIPELAWEERDRVRLSTMLAAASFPVIGVYSAAWTWGVELGRGAGLSDTLAVRWLVLCTAAVTLACCLQPILVVDERRFTRSAPARLSLRAALAATLANRPFRIYLGAQLLAAFALSMVQATLVYYATVVLGRSEGFAAWLGVTLLAATVAGLFAVNRLVARWGAKRTMLRATLVIGVALGALWFLVPEVPGGARDGPNLLVMFTVLIVSGVPVAAFLVVPHVLTSALVDYDTQRTGANRSAMYFAVQGFMHKWMYGASAACLAYLFARHGNSQQQPTGVLLVGPVAGAACLAAAALFARYPEDEVLAVTARPADSPVR